ncbi:hypothetical protein SAMN05216241_101136 [Limimonas halophila]|uniref:Uncharacterized protein n=1 Tax=Limimonas halophila TaxID=1082479 RepID=A0A1G7L667_9PROT|nr:hypothetical protein [Limimonas halophila]SDF45017.1 hypothetical protein SAMN05216241_101136 [Limimonas halophila]
MAQRERGDARPLIQRIIVSVLFALVALLAVIGWVHTPTKPEVFQLTHVACQFLEPERGIDHGFERRSPADCRRVNARTSRERLRSSRVFKLEAGRYTIRVTNKDVAANLGFWLRNEGYDFANPFDVMHRTSIWTDGATEGDTVAVTRKLEPGTYVYSGPKNPTPKYRLVVEKAE